MVQLPVPTRPTLRLQRYGRVLQPKRVTCEWQPAEVKLLKQACTEHRRSCVACHQGCSRQLHVYVGPAALVHHRRMLQPKRVTGEWRRAEDEPPYHVPQQRRPLPYWLQAAFRGPGNSLFSIGPSVVVSDSTILSAQLATGSPLSIDCHVPAYTAWPDRAASLPQAVSVHGYRWSAVATMVPGRGEMACRERFLNVLDPSRKSGNWTAVCPLRLQVWGAAVEHGVQHAGRAACKSIAF